MIYATGYSGWKYSDFITFVRVESVIIFDIRLVPWSTTECWQKRNLEKEFGKCYIHAVGFGNKNYRLEGVELADPETWIIRTNEYLSASRSLILLCGCRNPGRCHRTAVAALLKKKLDVSVQEVAREEFRYRGHPRLPMNF